MLSSRLAAAGAWPRDVGKPCPQCGKRVKLRRPMTNADAATQVPPTHWDRPSVRWLSVGALLLIVFALFGPALLHPFSPWDDLGAVRENPHFHPPTASGLAAFWRAPYRELYVPIVYTVWWMVAALTYAPGAGEVGNGLAAWPFHACSILAHAAAAVMVFLVLRRLVKRTGPAWVAAAVFAVHPIQVEPAVWLSTLYTPLGAAFALFAVWLYLRTTDAESAAGRRLWAGHAAAAACFALSLLTKPAWVALPLVLAVIDVGLRGRRPRDTLTALAWLLMALPIIYIARRSQLASRVYSPLWLRPFEAADALTFYARHLVVPFGFVPDYGRSPQWLEGSGWPLYLALALPAAVLVAAVVLYRRAPWVAVAAATVVLTALPTLGLIPFDYQRRSTVADRYFYASMFGVAIALAFALRACRRRAAMVVAGAVIVGLASLTAGQVHRWRDASGLFAYNLRLNPQSRVARTVLGYVASQSGRLDDAFEHYQAAIALDPDYYEARVGLAVAYVKAGRPADAEAQYGEALRISPNDRRVLFNLGNICLRGGRFNDAINAFGAAEAASLRTSELYSSMGVALAQAGRNEASLKAFRRSVELDPNRADSHLNLAIALLSRGELSEARFHYLKVIELNGNIAAAKRGLTVIDSAGPVRR
jgi:tetratricopeptide (TPR) repeat protein